MSFRLPFVLAILLAAPSAASAQPSGHSPSTPLHKPGQPIFGTVQEAIRALEADSTTDWSQVNVERLRQHLIDMHNVALHVRVLETEDIEGGVRLAVRPTSDSARTSLRRVLGAHPAMLKRETGWQMDVSARGEDIRLTVTDPSGGKAQKIRALGYIGLLSYGAHHQRHHWMLIRGRSPDSHRPGSHR